jgi:hypothetical protein
MEALSAMMVSVPGWVAASVPPLLALVAGYLAARWVHAGRARRLLKAARSAWRARLRKAKAHVHRLEQENLRLEEALREREEEVATLTAHMAEAAARDREELVRLQEELESDHRIGQEKARLIRSAEQALARGQAAFRQAQVHRERQRVSLSALLAALSHAKRAQASTEDRLGRLREQLLQQSAQAVEDAAVSERVVERIVEIPVETIVYRDREVPVEVPIEVPVGFTTFSGPAAAKGFKARYSENRPSST